MLSLVVNQTSHQQKAKLKTEIRVLLFLAKGYPENA